ncbi:MAG: aldo/keto reductase, partial [Chloroflexota bacterium]
IAPDDSRRTHPRFIPGTIEHNVTLLPQLELLAREKGITMPQLALAWVLAQGKDVFPIPSNKSILHLEENLKALEIRLSAEDLARLDHLMPMNAAKGDRGTDMGRMNL